MQSISYTAILVLSIVGPSHSSPILLSGLYKTSTPVAGTVGMIPNVIQQLTIPNKSNSSDKHNNNENEADENEDNEEENENETESTLIRRHGAHGSKSTKSKGHGSKHADSIKGLKHNEIKGHKSINYQNDKETKANEEYDDEEESESDSTHTRRHRGHGSKSTKRKGHGSKQTDSIKGLKHNQIKGHKSISYQNDKETKADEEYDDEEESESDSTHTRRHRGHGSKSMREDKSTKSYGNKAAKHRGARSLVHGSKHAGTTKELKH